MEKRFHSARFCIHSIKPINQRNAAVCAAGRPGELFPGAPQLGVQDGCASAAGTSRPQPLGGMGRGRGEFGSATLFRADLIMDPSLAVEPGV